MLTAVVVYFAAPTYNDVFAFAEGDITVGAVASTAFLLVDLPVLQLTRLLAIFNQLAVCTFVQTDFGLLHTTFSTLTHVLCAAVVTCFHRVCIEQ